MTHLEELHQRRDLIEINKVGQCQRNALEEGWT